MRSKKWGAICGHLQYMALAMSHDPLFSDGDRRRYARWADRWYWISLMCYYGARRIWPLWRKAKLDEQLQQGVRAH
jgi:hypothetical protein